MKVKLSREELYELVWSKPMTHASKELGISDVMLGKLCKQRNVPQRAFFASAMQGAAYLFQNCAQVWSALVMSGSPMEALLIFIMTAEELWTLRSLAKNHIRGHRHACD
jgi:hypothetical protein